jgi:hypothetical protein
LWRRAAVKELCVVDGHGGLLSIFDFRI